MPGVFFCPLEPVRVIEGPTENTDHIGKTLETQVDVAAAVLAKMYSHLLTASCGAMHKGSWLARRDLKISLSEDWFDKMGGSSDALTKFAVADRDTARRGKRFVSDCCA